MRLIPRSFFVYNLHIFNVHTFSVQFSCYCTWYILQIILIVVILDILIFWLPNYLFNCFVKKVSRFIFQGNLMGLHENMTDVDILIFYFIFFFLYIYCWILLEKWVNGIPKNYYGTWCVYRTNGCTLYVY